MPQKEADGSSSCVMKCIPVILSVLLAAVPAAAQRQIIVPERALDSIAKLAVPADCPLSFDLAVIDAGDVYEAQGIKEFRFNYTNRTQAPVRLDRVTSSCSCVSVRTASAIVEPGQSGKIIASFNPSRRFGAFEQRLNVYLNGSPKPSGVLVLKGNVIPADGLSGYPVAMGQVRLMRKNVSFGEVRPGEHREERIACVNKGSTSVTLGLFNGLSPEGFTVRTEPGTLNPGAEGDIVVGIDPASVPPMISASGKAVLFLEGVEAKPSDRSIEVEFIITDK